MHSSSFAKEPFEPNFEMASDDDNDRGMEQERIEYRPSASSVGEIYDDEDVDGSLEERQDDDASSNEVRS